MDHVREECADVAFAADLETRKAMAQQLANLEMNLPSTDIDANASTDNALKLPFDQLTAFGAAFASLPERFRTATGAINVPNNLFFATDKAGNLLGGDVLQTFNDGSGMMGSFRDAVNGFGQARLHQATPGALQMTAVAPINPQALFVAAALAQISHKLDAIAKTQQEMFEYLRQKDKAEIRGDLQTLADLREAYRFNWNNETWLANSHMKVMDIRQDMDQAIVHLRAQLSGKIKDRKFVESRLAVGRRLGEVADRMKEYQLALYVYSFAAFLEPLLSANFDASYPSSVAEHIDEHSLRYHELYTECYDAVESNAKAAVDAAVLHGVSFVGRKLGEAVAATPIGRHTPVDEALFGAGKGVGQFNEEQTDRILARLRDAKSPDVAPFRESVKAVNALYNAPVRMLADSKNLHVLPAAEG